jgi:hypothetical protein
MQDMNEKFSKYIEYHGRVGKAHHLCTSHRSGDTPTDEKEPKRNLIKA